MQDKQVGGGGNSPIQPFSKRLILAHDEQREQASPRTQTDPIVALLCRKLNIKKSHLYCMEYLHNSRNADFEGGDSHHVTSPQRQTLLSSSDLALPVRELGWSEARLTDACFQRQGLEYDGVKHQKWEWPYALANV